jgi:septum formation protein
MKSDPLQELGLPGPLILGSGSFTRKLILQEMGIDFHVIKRPIDEKGLGDRQRDTPHDLVLTLAKAKAHHLVSELIAGRCNEELPLQSQPTRQTNHWIVLTGDQVVTHGGDILEKPDTIEQAKDFCARYALAPPSTVGSCVLTHLPSRIQVAGVDSATIVFRPSIADTNPNDGLDLVDRLLRDGAPILDCAGGLMVEHPLVREHIERIDGTEDSVMGLSKELVLTLLKELKDKLAEQNLL